MSCGTKIILTDKTTCDTPEIIASGGFGNVYKIQCNGNTYALKLLRFDKKLKEPIKSKRITDFKMEIAILIHLNVDKKDFILKFIEEGTSSLNYNFFNKSDTSKTHHSNSTVSNKNVRLDISSDTIGTKTVDHSTHGDDEDISSDGTDFEIVDFTDDSDDEDTVSCETVPYLITEYLDPAIWIPLSKYTSQGNYLPEAVIETIFINVKEAIEYIHNVDVIHNDITPHNILFSSLNNKIKLIDFGMACMKQENVDYIDNCKRNANNLQYYYDHSEINEEQKNDFEIMKKKDLWSVGVLLYELLKGRVLKTVFNGFGGTNSYGKLANFLEKIKTENLAGKIDELSIQSAYLKDSLKSLLILDINTRKFIPFPPQGGGKMIKNISKSKRKKYKTIKKLRKNCTNRLNKLRYSIRKGNSAKYIKTKNR